VVEHTGMSKWAKSVDYTPSKRRSFAAHIPAWESESLVRHKLDFADIQSAELYFQIVCSAVPVGNLFSHFLDLENLNFLEYFHGHSLSQFLVVGCCILWHCLQLPSWAVEAEDHRSSFAMSFLRLRPQVHDARFAKFKLPEKFI
jgi:hypothetical protein